MTLLGVDPEPPCSCGTVPHDMDCALVVARFTALTEGCSGPAACEGTGPHRIDCTCIAAVTAHAMVGPDGDVFYPDSLQDAAHFTQHYGARPLHPAKFAEFFGQPPPPPDPWVCPNTPRCPHPALLHDIQDLEDPSPTCCFEGCRCGQPATAGLP